MSGHEELLGDEPVPAAVRPRDDASRNYIHIVDADEHHHELNPELLEACSKNFSMPVLFRKMVPLDDRVATRNFLEVNVDEKLVWRERTGDAAVAFRNEKGKTDYNYVSGREGTAREYLEQIFEQRKDVYAHLGQVSSGFADLHKHAWGMTIFRHVREEVFRSGWFQIPDWELSGHLFLGNNTGDFEEPDHGAPGSDWHMFPTVNVFVLLAGTKKWMTRPPQPGDQLRNQDELIFPTGGRERPRERREFDTVYLEPGDVLFNVPYEWHKVLNGRGWSLGAAFRVIDRPYIADLLEVPAVKSNLKLRDLSEEYSHLLTSVRMASRDPVRMQMCLNTAEMMTCLAGRFGYLM